ACRIRSQLSPPPTAPSSSIQGLHASARCASWDRSLKTEPHSPEPAAPPVVPGGSPHAHRQISLDVDACCRGLLPDAVLKRVRREALEHAQRSSRAYRSPGPLRANGHLVRDGRGTLLRAAYPGSASGAVATNLSDEWQVELAAIRRRISENAVRLRRALHDYRRSL